MCVIIYKKRGYEIPDKQFLQRCWNANPDGGGLAYNDNNAVHFKKGFENFKDFYNTLLNINTAINLKDKDLIIHFRIATSGGVTPQKTHPFEITRSYRRMERLKGTCKKVFFHNGIIRDFASKNYSDTENFNSMILSTIKDVEHQPDLIDYLAKINNSRFAIMTKNDVLLGNDFLIDNNMLVSNKNYQYCYNSGYYNYDKTGYQLSTFRKHKDYIYNDYNKYDYDYFD